MKTYPWKESIESLGEALEILGEALEMPLDEKGLVLDATIHRFKFTIELFWKTLKRFIYVEGMEAKSPKETLQMAYKMKWIDDEQLWLNMLNDRNETSHIYDEEKAKEIDGRIKTYYPALKSTYSLLEKKLS